MNDIETKELNSQLLTELSSLTYKLIQQEIEVAKTEHTLNLIIQKLIEVNKE